MQQAKKRKSTYVAKQYANPPIPYEISQPNKFWRIKKGIPPVDYWRKRYYRRRITGRGDYSYSDSRSTGANIGGYLGSKAGEFLGGAAQNIGTALLSGLGSYSVKKNVLLDGNMPRIDNKSGPGGITIRFQEYIGEVRSGPVAGAFNINTFLINPANSATFPWLSQIAANFEQYEIEGMLFGFRTTASDLVTNDTNNLQLGTVILATQYDVADAVFQSKAEMLNYQFSSSVKPSQGCIHMIECDPRQTSVNLLYCSPGSIPAGTDPRLYHLGRFSIATQGFQGDSVGCGELHVTYQVRLLKPKLWSNLGQTIPFSSFFNQFTKAASIGPILGPIATISAQSQPNGCNILFRAGTIASSTDMVFQANPAIPRKYLVCIFWNSAVAGNYWTSTNWPNLISPSGCNVLVSAYAPTIGVLTSAYAQLNFYVTVTGTNIPELPYVNLPPADPNDLPNQDIGCTIRVTVVDPDLA